MPGDANTILKLELRLERAEQDILRLQIDAREQFGLIKLLSGQASVTTHITQLQEQVSQQAQINMEQQKDIGKVLGAISAIRQALQNSSDKQLAEAAKSLVINVGDTTTTSHNNTVQGDRATIAQAGNTASVANNGLPGL